MDKLDRVVGRRIREQRRLAGLSQARLAEKVNVSPETISRLETGTATPSLARLSAIARALGVELHDLVQIRPADDERSRAIDRLVWLLSRRSEDEVELVVDIVGKVLELTRRWSEA